MVEILANETSGIVVGPVDVVLFGLTVEPEPLIGNGLAVVLVVPSLIVKDQIGCESVADVPFLSFPTAKSKWQFRVGSTHKGSMQGFNDLTLHHSPPSLRTFLAQVDNHNKVLGQAQRTWTLGFHGIPCFLFLKRPKMK